MAADKAAGLRPAPALRWPTPLELLDVAALERAIVGHGIVAIDGGERFIAHASRVVTFGSCFAANLGWALHGLGLTVGNALITEDLNSPQANRHLFDWLAGVCDAYTDYLERRCGSAARECLAALVRQSDVAVVTIGVGYALFHRDTGRFAFLPRHRDSHGFPYEEGPYALRLTGVEENLAELERMLVQLRTLSPQARIVLSVSPVPLIGLPAGDAGGLSAVEADCLSKATMRLVAHRLVERHPEIVYWPAFEIVRWLGGHCGFALFGGGDGNSRHVNAEVVRTIMRLFLKRHGVPELTEA